MGDEEKFIIYSIRPEDEVRRLYFWTGIKFSGDATKAKVFPTYADAGWEIWLGVLNKKSKAIFKLGFEGLHPHPVDRIDKDVPLERRGTQDIDV